MKYIKNTFALSAVGCLLLAGCGGGTDSSDNESELDQGDTAAGNESNTNDNVLVGIFVDSAVEGASYSTPTQSGTTNSSGEFYYLEGEQITFAIGDAEFPVVTAASQISPVDLASGSSNPVDTTTNIARLLQSLDMDGDPGNGITISTNAAANAAAINFDASTDQFANNSIVINLIANSESVTTALISEVDAISHLESELNTEISSVNNEVQADLRFTQDMLVGRTLVPSPIDGALQPYSFFRFDSVSSVMVAGTPNGGVSVGDFPWSLDDNGVVVIDFGSFEAGTLATLELQSVDGTVLTVLPTWKGVDDPIRLHTLSTPLTADQVSGQQFNVQSTGFSGSIDFLAGGQIELSDSTGDFRTGNYANHSVDGITISDFSEAYSGSDLVLASGTLDSGFLIKSDYDDSRIVRVEFFKLEGNTWTSLHSVVR